MTKLIIDNNNNIYRKGRFKKFMLGKLVDPLYINFIFSFQCIPLSINVYLYINVFYVMYLHIVLSDICRHIVTVLVTGHRQRGDWEAPGLHHAASKYQVQCDCPNI